MGTLLIECVVRTSLIAAVVALVLYFMCIKTGSARHAVWAGVVVVMLLLPAFLAWGPAASLPVLPRQARQTAAAVLPVAASPVIAPVRVHIANATPGRSVWNWQSFFLGVYLLGLSVLLLRLASVPSECAGCFAAQSYVVVD